MQIPETHHPAALLLVNSRGMTVQRSETQNKVLKNILRKSFYKFFIQVETRTKSRLFRES